MKYQGKELNQKEIERWMGMPIDKLIQLSEGFVGKVSNDPNPDASPIIAWGNAVNNDYIPDDIRTGKRNSLFENEADGIFAKALQRAQKKAWGYLGTETSHPDKVYDIITDMTYNMQDKINSFKKMKKFLDETNYEKAADEMLDSKYGTNDLTKGRAMRNALMLRSAGNRSKLQEGMGL